MVKRTGEGHTGELSCPTNYSDDEKEPTTECAVVSG